jgi:hypothetical protein
VSYDPATPAGQVRLLINDTRGNDPVFSDAEILGFLGLENGNIKRAAAQALDVIADDEALTGKVISSEGKSTNGPAVAASLRARATTLREQALYDLTLDDDEAFFQIVPMTPSVTVDILNSRFGGLV